MNAKEHEEYLNSSPEDHEKAKPHIEMAKHIHDAMKNEI